MVTFKAPESGIYVEALTMDGAPLIGKDCALGRFYLVDIAKSRVIVESEPIYAEGIYVNALGVINALHYAFTNGYRYIYTNSPGALSCVVEKEFKEKPSEVPAHRSAYKRLKKGIEWLHTLRFNSLHIFFTDDRGGKVNVRKWHVGWGNMQKAKLKT